MLDRKEVEFQMRCFNQQTSLKIRLWTTIRIFNFSTKLFEHYNARYRSRKVNESPNKATNYEKNYSKALVMKRLAEFNIEKEYVCNFMT